MAARYQIVESRIPQSGINQLRRLSRATGIEEYVAPRLAKAFERWLNGVAKAAARDFPVKSGKGRKSITASARVTGGASLSSIRGYFLVDPAIAAQEQGAIIRPRTARFLAIPIGFALRADGMPKRRGPRSWQSYGTFTWKSKRTGQIYIAYKPKGTREMRVLYVLVDKVQLRQKRFLRNQYDRQFPQLLVEVGKLVSDGIAKAYRDTLQTFAKNDGQTTLTRRNMDKYIAAARNVPNPSRYAPSLVPSYKVR